MALYKFRIIIIIIISTFFWTVFTYRIMQQLCIMSTVLPKKFNVTAVRVVARSVIADFVLYATIVWHQLRIHINIQFDSDQLQYRIKSEKVAVAGDRKMTTQSSENDAITLYRMNITGYIGYI